MTLIELMITVAIVGILVSIAVPRIINFRSRALSAEMKTNLSALRHAEKTYWAAKGAFTDDLGQIDWRPDGEPRYLFGFTSDAGSGRNDTAELAASGGGYSTASMLNGLGFPLTQGDLPPSVLSPDAFTAGAVANLDDDTALDRWTIDADGNLNQISDDVGN